MKKILYDFLSLEDKNINGGALYVKTILKRLLEEKIEIVGVCKNKDNLNEEIRKLIDENNIKILNIEKNWVNNINKQNFDYFFIGIAQRYNEYDLTNIKCKILIVCHDIADICMYRAGLSYNYELHHDVFTLSRRKHPKLSCYKLMVKRILKEKSFLGLISTEKIIGRLHYSNFSKLIKQQNVFVLTVSNYSKSAIEYYFEDIYNEIKVFYAPKMVRDVKSINISEKINSIVKDHKYFMLLSADRYNKNYSVFAEQFEKFNKKRKNEFKAVILGADNIKKDDFIAIKSVNDLELNILMENAYCLVYPSLGEGFGNPPLEAMQCGTPVIAAFDTSIPEICGNEILYFNPCYREDLYNREMELVDNYTQYKNKAKSIADAVAVKQNRDYERLIEFLVSA